MSITNYKIRSVLSVILLCLSCNSNFKVEAQLKSEKSKLSAKVFEKLDYKVKEFSENSPDDWHKSQFQTLWAINYRVKRRTSVKEQTKTFPRYTVIEEVYETEELASKRLERIHEKPPNLPIEQLEYWIVTGFQNKKTVYFIQTDSVLFSYYIRTFAF